MKAFGVVIIFSLLLGAFSIKAAVAAFFLGTCTALCLWINTKVRVPSTGFTENRSVNMISADFGGGDEDTIGKYDDVVKGRRVL